MSQAKYSKFSVITKKKFWEVYRLLIIFDRGIYLIAQKLGEHNAA